MTQKDVFIVKVSVVLFLSVGHHEEAKGTDHCCGLLLDHLSKASVKDLVLTVAVLGGGEALSGGA